MKRSMTILVLTILVLLATTLPVLAGGPGTTPLTGWRRPAYVVASGAGWAWGCMYSDSLSIYSGVRQGYRVGTGAASRFLTPRFAQPRY